MDPSLCGSASIGYKGEPVDYLGLRALASFLAPLLLTISSGRDSNTETSTLVLLGLGALTGGCLFVLRELLAPYPVVNLRMFRAPVFRLIGMTAFLNHLGLFGALFMVPIFLQQVLGLSPLQAGQVIAPALIVSGFTGVLAGKLSDLFPPPLVVIGTMIALGVIFFSFSSVTALTAMTVIVGYVILYRVCMNGSVTPLTVLLAQRLGTEQVRMAQGLLGVVRSVGSVLGVTVTSVFCERRRALHQLTAYDTYNLSSLEHQKTLYDLKLILHKAGIAGSSSDLAALGAIRRQMDIEAITLAFQDRFVFICVCFLLASMPMLYLFIRYRKP